MSFDMKNFLKNFFYQKERKSFLCGFTLIEILISMCILVLIAGFSFAYLGGFQQKSNADAAVQKIVSFTREAQMRAKNGQDGMAWGVHWENPLAGDDFYSLFRDTYSATSTIETIKLPKSVQFITPADGSSVEIIFQRITGNPTTATTTITVASKANASILETITINSLGRISY